MTIGLQTTYVQYQGNGTTTVFAFPNKIFEASDLAVTLISNSTGAAVVQSPTVYSVSNVDVDTGANVTMTTAPAAGYTLDLRSNTPELQDTSIANQGAYYPEVIEEALDQLTREVQDLYRLTYTFGIHGPDLEATAWPALPSASARAGLGLGFDDNGLPTVFTLLESALTQAVFNAFLASAPLFPITAGESAYSITPVSYAYPATPLYDPRRQGVTGTALAATPVDDTTSMNSVLSTVLSYQGGVQIPENFHILSKGLFVYFSAGGNRATQAIRIRGVSNVTSTINQNGDTITNGCLLNVAAPGTTVPHESNIHLEDFGISGTDYTQVGLNMQNVGLFTTDRLQVLGCAIGIENQSALVGTYRDNIIESNITGYKFVQYGTSSGANLVKIEGGVASGNQAIGIDLGGNTTDFAIEGVEVEGNGYGGHATSGSTTSLVDTSQAWVPGALVGQKVFVTVSGTTYSSTITANTATALTFGAIAAAVVAGDGYYVGGGLLIRQAIGGIYGIAEISIRNCHFESNYGFGIGTDGIESTYVLLSVEDTLITVGACGAPSQALNVGVTTFRAKNVSSAAAADSWTINAASSFIEHCYVGGGITDLSTYSTWRGVLSGGSLPLDSRPNPFTLTLSSTYGSGTVVSKQDGKRITLIFPQIAASGTGTAITGTGIGATTPANCLIPSVTRQVPCILIVNNVSVPGFMNIAAGTGTITLAATGGFTSSQINGIAACEVSYDL